MFPKAIIVALFALFSSVAIAQGPPPALTAPDHWEIHSDQGDTGLDFQATFVMSSGGTTTYHLAIKGIINGNPWQSYALVFMDESEGGGVLEVWNGDSGNWTTWYWTGSCYKKFGGTHHERAFYPVWP